MDDFKRFMHPGPECICILCDPTNVRGRKHPSLECTCCLADWATNGGGITFAEWLQSKLDNEKARAAAQAKKPAPKPFTMESEGHNIIIQNGNVEAGDALMLFGKWGATEPDGIVHEMPVTTTFADIMVKFAIFPSKGQAKKNGWDKPIPPGWSEWVIGKLKHKLWIWNPSPECNEA